MRNLKLLPQLLTVSILLIFTSQLHSQSIPPPPDWNSMMSQPNANFYTIKDEVDNYFNTYPEKKEYEVEEDEDEEIAPVVGGSEKFRAFINDELFPEINKRYRTTSEKSIIGESASGLFVMETFFLTPEMFDNYIAFDPSLWWNNHYLVRTAKEHLASFPETEKRLWFAGSNAKDISVFTKELAKIFKAENIANLKWKFSDEPKEKHTTIFRATKEKAIIWTLNKTMD